LVSKNANIVRIRYYRMPYFFKNTIHHIKRTVGYAFVLSL